MKKKDSKKELTVRAITAAVLVLFFYLVFFHLPVILFSAIAVCIFIGIVFFEWPRLFTKTDPLGWLLLPLYPTIPLVLAILLNHSPNHRILLVLIVLCAAVFDTGSYLFGSWFGKHKIASRISPGKSWEGAAGGYLATSFVLGATFWIQGTQITLPHVFLLTLVICTLALAGDLFESCLKRRAGIKDSGTFLPGHGGLLDRLDSILFLLPFFYLFRNCLVQLCNVG